MHSIVRCSRHTPQQAEMRSGRPSPRSCCSTSAATASVTSPITINPPQHRGELQNSDDISETASVLSFWRSRRVADHPAECGSCTSRQAWRFLNSFTLLELPSATRHPTASHHRPGRYKPLNSKPALTRHERCMAMDSVLASEQRRQSQREVD
ncbi:uncharacterized protein BDZ99DRAFT_29323 [Mytilinidion resinicola]|uniref:Uncharacterized protein n=1 Tax=Mytilinidion resinicola TaxID=574789 RepID=A0A6A6YKZ7_9PEZI|nr:uncharacterized protein BDZ99DRAFT_29323 [Mytilinidion resinicola]KAF2809491.1 hypothetical protein BDZ99DRAFT_29323 [Mytilinidion resinicola]